MFEQIEAAIRRQMKDLGEIYPGNILEDELGVCSFDMMAIVFELERECHTLIDASKFKKQMTVQDLVDIVEESKNG